MVRIVSPHLALPLILALGVGCAHVPQQSTSVKRAGLESSTTELRTRAIELGRDAIRDLEIAADSIDAATQDPNIHRNTLYLRLSAVPAIIEASLRADPVIAMLDLYAFRAQLAAFVTSAAGQAAFGDAVAIPRRALERNAERWEAVAALVGSRLTDEQRASIASWVASHPIDRLPFSRPSMVGALASKLRDAQTSIGAAVGGMQESLDRLEARISLANEYTIKQAQWLARLAALDVGRTSQAAELEGTLRSTRDLIEGTPDLVARERAAALADVDRQRRETLADLEAEVARQRLALVASVAEERALVLAAVDEQRRRAVRDADSLRVRLVADELHIVDHVLLRLAVMIGALVVAGGIGLLLLRRRP